MNKILLEREKLSREILELFCGNPVDCTLEAQMKLDDILQSFHSETTRLMVEEFKKIVGEKRRKIEDKRPIGDYELDLKMMYGYNQALDDLLQSLTE
jgi:hypothetical protein